MKTKGNTKKTLPSSRKLYSATLKNYFSTLMNRIEKNRLVVLHTGDVMNSVVETFLTNLLVRNEERYKEFYKHPS